jgi:hypothetical protein
MDVVVWLRSLGLGKYEALFRENDIDETVLPNLTAEDLKELGERARRGSCRHSAQRVLPPYRRSTPAARRFPPLWIIDGTFGLSSSARRCRAAKPTARRPPRATHPWPLVRPGLVSRSAPRPPTARAAPRAFRIVCAKGEGTRASPTSSPPVRGK